MSNQQHSHDANNHFLIYASKCSADLSELDLISIIYQSCDNNQHSDITGVLVHKPKQFLQIIEGDKHNIAKLYRKIRSDKRHFSLQTLILKSNSKRISSEFLSYKHARSEFDTRKYGIFFEDDFDFGTLSEYPYVAFDFLRDLAGRDNKTNQDKMYLHLKQFQAVKQLPPISLDDLI